MNFWWLSHAVGRQADDLNSNLAEIRGEHGEVLGLQRASGRIVLGVEIQDDALSLETRQLELVAAFGGQFEVWSLVPFVQHDVLSHSQALEQGHGTERRQTKGRRACDALACLVHLSAIDLGVGRETYFGGVVAGGEGGVVAGGEGCAAGGEDGVVVTSSPLIMANAAMTTTTAATAAPISRFLLLFTYTLLQLAARTAQLKPATALEMATPSLGPTLAAYNGSWPAARRAALRLLR